MPQETPAQPRRRDEVVTIRITRELKAALMKRAQAEFRPLSSYIEVLLRKHVEADADS